MKTRHRMHPIPWPCSQPLVYPLDGLQTQPLPQPRFLPTQQTQRNGYSPRSQWPLRWSSSSWWEHCECATAQTHVAPLYRLYLGRGEEISKKSAEETVGNDPIDLRLNDDKNAYLLAILHILLVYHHCHFCDTLPTLHPIQQIAGGHPATPTLGESMHFYVRHLPKHGQMMSDDVRCRACPNLPHFVNCTVIEMWLQSGHTPCIRSQKENRMANNMVNNSTKFARNENLSIKTKRILGLPR